MIAVSRLSMMILTPLFFISSFARSQYWPHTIPTDDYDFSYLLHGPIYRGEYTPTAGEGIKQLLNRLGETANQIETKALNLPDISELLELEYVQLHCATILYASDFETTGTIIDAPGYYILCDDIEYAGTGDAIMVRSSHVTIDLNTHAIYATGSASKGIYIDSTTTALHNIVVKNGTIANFSSNGLKVQSSVSPGFSNLQLDSVKFENNSQYNILLNGDSGSEISNCRVSNCTTTGASLSGMYMNYCQDFVVVYSNFNNNSQDGVETSGLATKCYFECCVFNDNGLRGVDIKSDSQTCAWIDCMFNNNDRRGIELNGNSGRTHSGFIFRNCIANNSKIGFDITNGTGGILTNCTSINNIRIDFECAGVLLTDCSSCLLEGCVSSANQNNSTSGCFGILLRQSTETAQDNILIQCSADGNNNAGSGGSVGIEIGDNVKNTVVSGCSAFSNSGTGISNNNTDLTSPTIIIGCVAGNNQTNFGGQTPAHYARRDRLGSHWQTGAQENIALETDGVNDVGCIIYLDQDAFPLTIDQPGHYILCDDITISSGTAVTINTDFVLFNLNGKSISGTFSDGFTIGTGQHDIVIKNGSLSGFSNNGMSIGAGCYHIDIENLDISNTSCVYGMQFAGIDANGIHNCSIKNCRLTELTATNILSFSYCYDCQVNKSYFNSNTTTGPVVSLNNAHKSQFIDCQFNDNNINADELIYLSYADSTIFDHCTFNNNQSEQNFNCITFYNTHGCLIKNSTFNNNTSQANFAALSFRLNSSGNTVESCFISNSTGSTIAGGIALQSPNNHIEKCFIQAVLAGSGAYGIASAHGIGGSLANNNSILSSEIFDINSSGNGSGIDINNSVENTLVKDCLLFNNTTYGINNDGTDSIIIGCAAGNNGTANYGGTLGAAALNLYMTGTDVAQTVYKYDNVEFVL